jgi:type II secretory ATPase GspE/PulE/Tfp pilus assembly ATPase PilB-like protein
MSRLDISERRRPQDGKINFSDFSSIKLELRVAVLPTHDNMEDVVMRLLASSKPIPLPQLGFSVRDDAIIKRLTERPFGLILACGPTGSGKTTTLHSLLAHINTDNRKIWTAEDPIEITQKGLRQLQVNPKIGVTFASAMRAFLRADPDVIMIGEVRDEETASVCVEASLTGHLVLSTLHTNSAAESVIRLLDLGMDPMNFGDSLVGIVAQRLVRGLCKHCAQSKVLSRDEYEALVLEYIDGTTMTPVEGHNRLLQAASNAFGEPLPPLSMCHAVGCEQCGGRGYKGRMGIYEILENVGDMRQKIQSRAPTTAIFAEACKAGMRTLRQDALEKVMAGLIDLKQARTIYA